MAPKTKSEVLWIGKRATRPDGTIATAGCRLPSDDPLASERPDDVVPAPERDGTFIVVRPAWHRRHGIVSRGQIVTEAVAKDLTDLVYPGPIQQNHLRSVGAAVEWNRPEETARRAREREAGLARRAARTEAKAAEAERVASEAEARAAELRSLADRAAVV